MKRVEVDCPKIELEVTDSAVASVVWRLGKLYQIVLVRRSDGAVALVDVLDELRDDFVLFNRAAVIRHRMALQGIVQWALPDAGYSREMAIGKHGLCNGTTPAELGGLADVQCLGDRSGYRRVRASDAQAVDVTRRVRLNDRGRDGEVEISVASLHPKASISAAAERNGVGSAVLPSGWMS